MSEIEETVTRVKGMMGASVEAIRREEKERAVEELMRRNPAGTDRLVGDLKTMTFTEIEEV